MHNHKVSFEIFLLFFVALLGGLISTIIYRLNLSIKMMIMIALANFIVIIGLIFAWELSYNRERRKKDFSDRKETRNNTREILERIKKNN